MTDFPDLPFAKVIRIEPAGLCNLKCSHCPTGTVKMKRGIMDTETFEIVIENIKENIDFIKVAVLYHGGEPLLNKKLVSMIENIKDTGISFVKTVSNGMLLNEKWNKALIKSGLDSVEISLDATSPELSDLVRRKSDSKKVMTNIKKLVSLKEEMKSKRPDIIVTTTQFRNKDEEHHHFDAPIPDYLLKEFYGENKAGKISFKSNYAMRWPHMKVDDSFYGVYRIKESNGFLNVCDNLDSTITVRWNGDIVPCCYDLTSRYVLGNIHEEKLSVIWNNARSKVIRSGVRSRKPVSLCKKCNTIFPSEYLYLRNA